MLWNPQKCQRLHLHFRPFQLGRALSFNFWSLLVTENGDWLTSFQSRKVLLCSRDRNEISSNFQRMHAHFWPWYKADSMWPVISHASDGKCRWPPRYHSSRWKSTGVLIYNDRDKISSSFQRLSRFSVILVTYKEPTICSIDLAEFMTLGIESSMVTHSYP